MHSHPHASDQVFYRKSARLTTNSASGHPAPLSHSPQTCSGIGAFYQDRAPAPVASAGPVPPKPGPADAPNSERRA